MTASLDQIRQHWDSRAALGETAGTQDLILKELEQRVILREIARATEGKSARVLEVGCGRGETAKMVACLPFVRELVACDASWPMIEAASKDPSGVSQWLVCDARTPPEGPFDAVYSQRCLINLPRWSYQLSAIDAIADVLVPGGRFVMVEHSYDGLCWINVARAACGLDHIEPPFHNRYLRDDELADIESLRLVECVPFSARYYYHSRVINAWLAKQEGREPDYRAPVNRMALETDAPFDGRYAQGRAWIWEKQ